MPVRGGGYPNPSNPLLATDMESIFSVYFHTCVFKDIVSRLVFELDLFFFLCLVQLTNVPRVMIYSYKMST